MVVDDVLGDIEVAFETRPLRGPDFSAGRPGPVYALVGNGSIMNCACMAATSARP